MSFHHRYAIAAVVESINKIAVLMFLFIKIRPDITKVKALFDARIGQGLMSTK